MENTEASEARRYKPSGQCAYEAWQARMHHSSFTAWKDLPREECEAWFHAAVEGWKKIQEANTDKRYMT